VVVLFCDEKTSRKKFSETFTKHYRSKFNKNMSTDWLISKNRFYIRLESAKPDLVMLLNSDGIQSRLTSVVFFSSLVCATAVEKVVYSVTPSVL